MSARDLPARLRAVAARGRGDWAAGREALDELAAVEQSKARHPSAGPFIDLGPAPQAFADYIDGLPDVGHLLDPDGLRLPPAARTVL